MKTRKVHRLHIAFFLNSVIRNMKTSFLFPCKHLAFTQSTEDERAKRGADLSPLIPAQMLNWYPCNTLLLFTVFSKNLCGFVVWFCGIFCVFMAVWGFFFCLAWSKQLHKGKSEY